jgi:hypothetical protein
MFIFDGEYFFSFRLKRLKHICLIKLSDNYLLFFKFNLILNKIGHVTLIIERSNTLIYYFVERSKLSLKKKKNIAPIVIRFYIFFYCVKTFIDFLSELFWKESLTMLKVKKSPFDILLSKYRIVSMTKFESGSN